MRKWALVCGVLIGGVLAVPARRLSDGFEIRADGLNSGGARRVSATKVARDLIGPGQPAGVTRSMHYENRSGLVFLITFPRRGDLDENGVVDIRDLLVFTRSWKTEAGDADYNFQADLVQSVADRRINEEDLLAMIRLLRR